MTLTRWDPFRLPSLFEEYSKNGLKIRESEKDIIVEAVVGQVSRPEPINLAYNTNTTLLELIAELESVLGRSLERVHEAPRAGDVKTSQADASRVQALFPGVRPVELRTGLEATVDWYRGHLGSR